MPMAFAFGQMLLNAARPMTEGIFSGFQGGGLAFGAKQAAGARQSYANCGADVAPDAAFCPKCGTAVPKGADKSFCRNCGRELSNDDNFWPKCGTKAKG
jgi:RNA polymerase subunit RPABC4/transcription elongation factor Spt4